MEPEDVNALKSLCLEKTSTFNDLGFFFLFKTRNLYSFCLFSLSNCEVIRIFVCEMWIFKKEKPSGKRRSTLAVDT